jgi:hypothetical protein
MRDELNYFLVAGYTYMLMLVLGLGVWVILV